MAAKVDGARLVDVSTLRAPSLGHVRPVQPLRFPEQEPDEERMGQGRRHIYLCVALNQMLRSVCGPEHTVGFDQFVYFDASEPRRCLAPDAFVTLGVQDHSFESYLVWEEGTPDLAFEILSPSDSPERWTFEEKLERYRALGVHELVTFHVDAEPGQRLRVWDRIEHDLVERVVTGDTTPCLTLGLTLLVGPVDELPVGLRLARDTESRELVLTAEEGRHAEREGRLAERQGRLAEKEGRLAERRARLAETEGRIKAEEARRAAEEASLADRKARAAAEARLAELEASLAATKKQT
jgi:Uma2 family endonuclease